MLWALHRYVTVPKFTYTHDTHVTKYANNTPYLQKPYEGMWVPRRLIKKCYDIRCLLVPGCIPTVVARRRCILTSLHLCKHLLLFCMYKRIIFFVHSMSLHEVGACKP